MLKIKKTGILQGLKIGFLFTGTITGAGFASGKEIIAFFGKSGDFFPFICIIAVILFFLTGLLFMTVAKRDNLLTVQDITKNVFKKGHRAFNLFIFVCQIVIFSAMIAAVDALFGEILGISKKIPLFSTFSLILCCVGISFGIKGLMNVNLIVVPIMIILVFLIIFFKPKITPGIFISDITPQSPLLFPVLSCVSYVGMNMLLAMNALITSGGKANKKHMYIGATSGSLIIGILMFVIGNTVFNSLPDIQNSDIPLLALTYQMPGIFRLLCLIVIWCSIFTSMMSSMFQTTEYLRPMVKNNLLNMIIVLVTGFALSRIGFSSIIGFVFPVIGAAGAILIIAFWILSRKKKEYKIPKNIKVKTDKMS